MICVFSSRSSLEFVRESFHKHLTSILRPHIGEDYSGRLVSTLIGLPVIFLLACDPSYLDDLPYLQQQGARLADSLNCSFVGLEPSTSHLTADRRARQSSGLFTEDQIQRVLKNLITTTTDSNPSAQTSGYVNSPPVYRSRRISSNLDTYETSCVPNHTNYDVKLLICLMCGDDYSPELVLSPLLNYQSCSSANGKNPIETSWNEAETPAHPNTTELNVNNLCNGRSFQNEAGLDRKRTFIIETFLPNLSRKIRAEITVTAYHTGFVWLAEHVYHHGYILVYSAKRRASLSSL